MSSTLKLKNSIKNTSILFDSILTFFSPSDHPTETICYLCPNALLICSNNTSHTILYEIRLTGKTILLCEGSDTIVISQPNNLNYHLRSEKSNLIQEWFEKIQSSIFSSFPEIEFETVSIIGEGTYGKVYLNRMKDSGELFAIKEVSKQNLFNKNQLETIHSERNILASIQHPFIVQLFDAFQSSKNYYLCLEFIPGGNLLSKMRTQGIIHLDDVRIYVAEIAIALHHLHSKHIVYHDLKPENILINTDGHIKLTDFGSSKDVSTIKIKKDLSGTLCYLAPEVIDDSNYGTEIDWWALGILTYEMLFKVPPFFSIQENRLKEKIRSQRISFPSQYSFHLKDLICGLLERNPLKRYNYKNIETHPFFEGMNFDDVLKKKYILSFIPPNNFSHERIMNQWEDIVRTNNTFPKISQSNFQESKIEIS
jgi:serine/threonine protein kinase